ncbi:hypothetical protein HGM15179_017876 [Zosterops borbonicus]|uniref:Uncharacterized protein n=1 Tax=Zosterops borbonicus TaxID=364589 RepID=A0A8K1G064_9PASS|nr:hypothetical protein HGM15179_017876 [Zosterops borbonicus]
MTAQGWKHCPTICHGLIQDALKKDDTPEDLKYIDIIVWGNTAEEDIEKEKKIIQILLKAYLAIKLSKFVIKPGLNANVLNVGYCGTVHLIKEEVLAVNVIH